MAAKLRDGLGGRQMDALYVSCRVGVVLVLTLVWWCGVVVLVLPEAGRVHGGQGWGEREKRREGGREATYMLYVHDWEGPPRILRCDRN